jgi:PAS domain S-box-containing protein
MRHIGLIARVLLTMTAVGFAILALAGTLLWDQSVERDRRRLDMIGKDATERLATVLADPLQAGDDANLRARLELADFPDLLAIELDRLPDHQPILSTLHGAPERLATQIGRRVAEAPILAHGRPIAAVRVSIDEEPAAAARHRLLGWTLGLGTALLAVLDLLVAHLLATLVVRPLRQLDRQLVDPTTDRPIRDPLVGGTTAPEVRIISHRIALRFTDQNSICRRYVGRCSLDHAILSAIGDGVITMDPAGRITAINPIAERLTGRSASTALGAPWATILVHADGGAAPDALANDLANGSHAGHRMVILTPEGRRRTLLTRTARLADNRGSVLVLRDETDRLELEERLCQAEKLEDLGRMAGGVAHDFNNLLTSIITASEMLARHTQGDATAERFSSLILRSSEQAADLTRQLLRFARNSRPERTPIDLHDTLRHAISVVEKAPGVPCDFHLHLLAPNARVLGNSALLSAVFINLGINARDAMPRGGSLCIASREVEIIAGDEVLAPFRLRPGAHLAITITDTGIGMDEATRNRLFQPFFTTKRPGKGTGLGLATCYATLRDHGGAITVQSALGCGSTFTVYLPLSHNDDSSSIRASVTEVRQLD